MQGELDGKIGVIALYKVGESVRYMEPLDHVYSYGVITECKKGRAEIRISSGFHKGWIVEIPYRFLEHMRKRW